MRGFRLFTAGMAVLLAGGEIARRAMTGGAVQALDEVAVALVLGFAALRPRPALLAAAWGGFSALMLALLTTTLGEMLHPAGKPGGDFYAVVLGLLLLAGLLATRRALRHG
ncbi:hypothetical protein [Teichococcus vastitatis]|uniref:Uncharacterized protein n=1 Tax=Teichococcus vastitatis TaxID=2307076 RepID=A0ABS9W0Z1_9PROT|nr:hypothetical protein [Pseudoroseomonas vastitatis]MCI0752259.1 hypothetical protein [Pseudoroseomonas vastitatis]